MSMSLLRLSETDLSRFQPAQRFRLAIQAQESDSYVLSQKALQAKARHTTMVIVVADAFDAQRLSVEMRWFAPELTIRVLPDWETLPYDVMSPQEDIISERLETLYALENEGLDVLLVSAVTASQRLCPVSYVGQQTFFFKCGDTLSLTDLQARLVKAGYSHVKEVLAQGEFAVRGGLIDVYPMGSEHPFRIDLFDDEIESIKWFDVETQRSMQAVDAIRLLPGHEFPVDEAALYDFRQRWRAQFPNSPRKSPIYTDAENGILSPGIEYYLPLFFEKTSTFADFLPANTLILLMGDVEKAIEGFWRDMVSREKVLATDPSRPPLPPELLWLNATGFFTSLMPFARITLVSEPVSDASNALANVYIDRALKSPLERLKNQLDTWKAMGQRVLICAGSLGRKETMTQLFASEHLAFESVSSWAEFVASTSPVSFCVAPLFSGAMMAEASWIVLTETELYRVSARRERVKRSKYQATSLEMIIRDVAELKLGDAVVHVDHGVGRYLGLTMMEAGEVENEFLQIEYANEAMLYVPITSLHLISRYVGTDPDNAPLHTLGRGDWQKARRKACEEIRDTAAELLNLYALRKTREGFQFELSPTDYERFVDEFAFEETPDQSAAIRAVIEDMVSGKSMDRLVCGDVGFGKTEVALRAAFVAAMNGKQVAVLCPTTLLAEQHAQTFKDRFSQWPIRIAELSRFRSSKETTQTVEALATGGVDIVIGTHKILSEKVKFANLGLVIIDEEHRFGVRQKEALRQLRAEVDILTLTATPIPRTLSMSLEGIRDFSVIATPPDRRLSVKTFVQAEDEGTIREAVMRELKRGGQVYFLHNEVATIENRRLRLEALLPEARIVVAHGQMAERELEHVMRDFYQQRYNVLLCTTIIETGIDVPTANTIIISRADKLGLAQLHQLRGRVGRSYHQAYAYLLTPGDGAFTKEAQKRLEAISSLESLGSGFYLAMHDLEIRGAGEVLGEHQSGEISRVGFELYNRMLLEAVKALRKGQTPNFDNPLDTNTDINLHAPTLLPADYVSDVSKRLMFYKELASATTSDMVRDCVESLVDCYGKLPAAARRLVDIHHLRIRCQALGIKRIDAGASAIVVHFEEKPTFEPLKLIQFMQSRTDTTMSGPQRLRIQARIEDPDQRLSLLQRFLMALE